MPPRNEVATLAGIGGAFGKGGLLVFDLVTDSLVAAIGAALDAAVSAPEPPQRPPTNGAEVIADMMAATLRADG